jgi:hypothetical protein
MKNRTRAVFVMGLLMTAACGDSDGNSVRTEEQGPYGVTRQGLDGMPADDGDDTDDASVGANTPFQVRGCTYVVSTPQAGPQFQIILNRLPSQNCQAASVNIAITNIDPNVMVVTKGGQAIVISYRAKDTPSGSASVGAALIAISPKTLQTLRFDELLGPPVAPSFIASATAVFFQGNRLIVEGTKNGPITGEIGSGSHFIATFPRFLKSMEPPTVVAFN